MLKHGLHPRDKSHLIMVYILFNVSLDSVHWYFIEEFCNYIHQVYWLSQKHM